MVANSWTVLDGRFFNLDGRFVDFLVLRFTPLLWHGRQDFE
jgi:hypothetical protein